MPVPRGSATVFGGRFACGKQGLKAFVTPDRVERRIASQVQLEMETRTRLESRQPFHGVIDVAKH
jgi:hypothetical protein